MWQAQPARLTLLELLITGRLSRRRSQEEAFRWLEDLPWTRATGRRDEVCLVESRRDELLALLDRVWPDWRDAHLSLLESGLSPTPDGWRRLEDRQRAGSMPDLPERLNRRTASAVVGPHAKAALTPERVRMLGDMELVDDGLVRIRPVAGMVAHRSGRQVPLDDVVAVFDEVGVADRALRGGLRLEGTLQAVLLVENLGAWRDMPRPEGWVLAHVPGWNTTTVGQLLASLGEPLVIHFGDLDPNGVRIHRHLRARLPRLGWLVPSFWGEYIDTHALVGVWPEDLDLAETPPLVRDLARRGLWLEQERIVLDPRMVEEMEVALGGTVERG